VQCTATEDHLGLVVAIPEDLPDVLSDELEEHYDELQIEQADLSKSAGDLNRLAGFNFTLPDGQSRILPVQTEMANRLLAHFSLEEIQGLLNAVAECTVNPKDEHLCKILAAQKNQ
jgi:hypothetical protein